MREYFILSYVGIICYILKQVLKNMVDQTYDVQSLI